VRLNVRLLAMRYFIGNGCKRHFRVKDAILLTINTDNERSFFYYVLYDVGKLRMFAF
jgi:hypothetical protein